MPNFNFRCGKCNKEAEDWLPFKGSGDQSLYPICCGEPMKKLLSAPPFTFMVPPAGKYYPTIDKVCSTESEFHRHAEKTKKEMREAANEREPGTF